MNILLRIFKFSSAYFVGYLKILSATTSDNYEGMIILYDHLYKWVSSKHQFQRI